MKRQRGQTMIEFALMFPFMALFIFGMIYGGAMFMEYLNFSNNARQIAREISVLDNIDKRKDIIKSYSKEGKVGERTFTSFYEATRAIYFKDKDDKKITYNESGKLAYADNTNPEGAITPVDVVVEVTFERNNADLPNVLKWVGFPPETINPIIYRMRLEKEASDDTSSNP